MSFDERIKKLAELGLHLKKFSGEKKEAGHSIYFEIESIFSSYEEFKKLNGRAGGIGVESLKAAASFDLLEKIKVFWPKLVTADCMEFSDQVIDLIMDLTEQGKNDLPQNEKKFIFSCYAGCMNQLKFKQDKNSNLED